MFNLSIAWWEFPARAFVVYVCLLIGLRLSGKRQIGQLAIFDLVLLLIISNAVQNSMNGGDNSLVGGLISAFTLLVMNFVLGKIVVKDKKLANLMEGEPLVLVHNGVVSSPHLDKAGMTHEELRSQIRQSGCGSLSEVRVAILETSGKISVIKKDGGHSS